MESQREKAKKDEGEWQEVKPKPQAAGPAGDSIALPRAEDWDVQPTKPEDVTMDMVEDEEYERADELNSSIEEAKGAYEEAIREWYRSQEECEDVAAQFADVTESKSEVKMRFAGALKGALHELS